MEFRIERAKAQELDEIEAIFDGARSYMRAQGNASQWTGGYPGREALISDLEKQQLYVCRARGDARIAAVFVYYEGTDPNYAVIDDGAWKNDLPYGVMHRVAVAEHARGKGVPRFCMDACFRRCGNLRIDTHEDNAPMQSLIAKCGFQRCGIVYMEDGSPRIAYQKTARLILASASPRRKELMRLLDVPFLAEAAKGEERLPDGVPAEQAAEYLSEQKAREIFEKHAGEDVTVIGSDTVVLSGGKIFGKPADEADAARMLRALSGRTHEVRTGVTIMRPDGLERFTEVTEVSFYPLSEAELAAYIETGEPMDKAGAYGIQGKGALLVREIRGDYYTVMGFPIAALSRRLTEADLGKGYEA